MTPESQRRDGAYELTKDVDFAPSFRKDFKLLFVPQGDPFGPEVSGMKSRPNRYCQIIKPEIRGKGDGDDLLHGNELEAKNVQ